jgi:hypothetical protein
MLSTLLSIVLMFLQANSGVIEGTVTRYGTTEGLAGVRITITRDGQQELEYEPDALTDAAGRFLIRNASPGAYTIRAARPGYVPPAENGVARQDGGAVKKITVDLQRPSNVTLSLVLGAALAGQILDPQGRPAEGARVEAVRTIADGGDPMAREIQTDDRGHYRLFGLPPGTYTLSVEFPQMGPRGGGIPTAQESWLKTYFPGTIDASRAANVEVRESAVIENLNFGFQTGQAFKISGKIIDPGRAKRSAYPDYYLFPLDSRENKVTEAPRLLPNVIRTQTPNITEDQAFEIRGLRPGRYLLYVEDWQSAPVMHDNFVVAQAVIEVQGDVTGLTLTMSGTSIVEGTVRSGDRPVSNIRVALIPSEDMRAHPMFYKEVRSDANGKFTVRGVLPGEYRAFAIDEEALKDTPPPASLYALPPFLSSFEQQGIAIRAIADQRTSVNVAPLRQ